MNQFLTWSFIPLLISCALRWYITSVTGAHPLDVSTFTEIENWAYSISTLLAVASFWHNFLRPSCPNCASYAVRHLRTEELNQYHTVRKVQEKDNNGRSVTRSLNVTVAEMRSHHDCADCGSTWTKDFKRDKK